MTTILAVLLLATVLSVIATLLMIRVSVGFGIMDNPDETRHVHGRPVPKLGGVAVFIGFAVPVMLLMHLQGVTLTSNLILGGVVQVGGLLVGSAVVLAIGLLDDILDLSPRWKLVWQVVSAAVAFKAGFAITTLSFPFFGAVQLGMLSFPATIFWFLLCMNAVNLLDGHDGLAAGACLFVGLTLLFVSLSNNNVLGAILMASLVGASLGFLFFNFPPAKIFLGDCGSLLLGYLVAGLSLVGATMKAETAFALLVPVVAMGLPLFDTLFAIMRRLYARMPVSMGDRGHIHHVLGKLGYSSRRVVLLLYGVTVLLCSLAFIITVMRNEVVLIVVVGLCVTAFVAIRIFSGITPSGFVGRYFADRSTRTRIVKASLAFQNSIHEIKSSSSESEIWSACVKTLKAAGVRRAELEFEKEGVHREMRWPADSHSDSSDWFLRIPFQGRNGLSGGVAVEVDDDNHEVVALPEFIGLLERIRSVLEDSIGALPGERISGKQSE